MPYYDFLKQSTGEIKTLFFHMNDKKEYTDETGYKWTRLFSKPNAAVDSQWDAFSSKDFSQKVGNKRGSYGDILDKSAELSKIRESKEGVDTVKQSYYDSYAKKRKGRRHQNEKREKGQAGFTGVEIEF